MTLLKYHFIKHFSTTTSPTSSLWRTQVQEHQLVTQISTILLQRNNWSPLLKTLNLPSKLTPQIFYQILQKTQQNPTVSLTFFNWAKSNVVGLKPDLKAHCKLIQILLGSGLTRPIKPILNSFIGLDPPTHVVSSMNHACKGSNLHSLALSYIIESYAQKGAYISSLEVYMKMLDFGYLPNVGCLNVVLGVLDNVGEVRLGYCLCGSMFRNRVLYDDDTWSVFARMLCKSGKFERVVRLLDKGVSNSAIFDLVIDGYSRIGNLGAAIGYVNEMCRRGFDPGFSTYGSILNGACKFGNGDVVDKVMFSMRERKLLPEDMSSGYDDVIKKFCDLGKSYAAELLFERARGEGFGLKDVTFGCLLSAYCKGGRVTEAIRLYGLIWKGNVVVKKSFCHELADCLCKENPSEEIIHLLKRLIKRGFCPSVSEISKFMMKLGGKDNWHETEALLNVMLQADLLPDAGCCRLLVKHYCSSGQIDSALMLHRKLGLLDSSWDVTTYNVVLRALFMEKKVDDALKIFECMRVKNVLNRASFVVMISGLSQEKEMRKAMRVHDEMLDLGLKPSPQTYKSLISVFR